MLDSWVDDNPLFYTLCRFKLLDDSAALPARRASNLAKMLGDLLIKGWLTLGVIKVGGNVTIEVCASLVQGRHD
jgi:hypothetical protein